MRQFFLLGMLSLSLVACERMDREPHNQRADAQDYEEDNTGRNVRDRNAVPKTSFDQSETENDRMIIQQIRQAVVEDDALSANAKNVKIISVQGVVTLRGPVANSQERDAIAKKASEVRGVIRVDNQLEVNRNN
jgi:hyperosmotically inducible protein